MAINKQLMSNVVLIAIALMSLLALPTASWAATSQGNQAVSQAAILMAPEPDTEIAIYPQPGTRQRRIAYGEGGDSVMVLEQVGSNTGVTWNRIRVDKPPYAEGWVQEQFLSLQGAAAPSSQGWQTTGLGDRQDSDRRVQPNSPSRSQTYSQQTYSQHNQY